MTRKLLCLILLAPAALCAQGLITTVAGSSPVVTTFSGRAANLSLGTITAVVVRADQSCLLLDTENSIIMSVSLTGEMTVIAGTGVAGYSGDGGPATQAMLNRPKAIFLDPAGNLYISDSGNNRVRKISNGIITSIVGKGVTGFMADSAPIMESLADPGPLTVDSSGTLFVVYSSNMVWRVTKTTVNQIAGGGDPSKSGDGLPALGAYLGATIGAIVYDANKNLYYFTDTASHRLRTFEEGGTVGTVAGTGVAGLSGDGGPAGLAQLSSPRGLWLDSFGFVYIADSGNNRIRRFFNLAIDTIIGSATYTGFTSDFVPGTQAALLRPLAVAIGPTGDYYIADSGNFRVRRMTQGVVYPVAGNGNSRYGGDGGPATSAQLYFANAVAADAAGNIYVSDFYNNRIRKVDSSGIITTIAGNGTAGYAGDGGPASKAILNGPAGLTFDASGNLYVADSANHRIRRITPSGTISTYIGNGQAGFAGDGFPFSQGVINTPLAMQFDKDGLFYFVDGGNCRIRHVNINGVLLPFAGAGFCGYLGDDDIPLAAGMNPVSLAIDPTGTIVYFADLAANRIRRVANNLVTTIAGTEVAGASGDGAAAAAATMNTPRGLVLDKNGNLYVCTGANIRRITNGVINTVAGVSGSTVTGYAGDGDFASKARMNCNGVGLSSDGSLLIADGVNNRVRRVGVTAPVFSAATQNVNFTTIAGVNPAAQTVQLSGTAGLAWQAALTSSGWLSVSAPSGVVPAALTVSANVAGLSAGTYTGTITLQTAAGGATIFVALFVNALPAAELNVAPTALSLLASGTSSALSPQSIAITNPGASLQWTASVSTSSGGNWLSVSSTSGRAAFDSSATLQVSFNTQGLTIGTYQGQVTVMPASGAAINVPVRLVVSAAGNNLLLSQTGLLFDGAAGKAVPNQQIVVSGTAGAAPAWTAEVVSGTWLSVTSSAAAIQAQANTTGLAAGSYYGLIRVSSASAPNSPQFVTVVLNLAGQSVPPSISTWGMIFAGAAGGAAPAAQTITVSGSAVASVSTSTSTGGSWLSATVSGSVVSVTATQTGLAVGAYQGTVTITPSDGTGSRNVLAVLVVSAATPCTATKLVAVVRQPAPASTFYTGWPLNVEARVLDDCGNPVNDATVAAGFSSGDAGVQLASVGDGVYGGTWKPFTAGSYSMSLAAAKSPLAPAALTMPLSGLTSEAPRVLPGGIVNGASFAARAPITPGSIVSVFGNNLARGISAAGTTLPTTLGGAKLTIGGKDVPLFYASPGQVNGQAPFDLPVNTTALLVAKVVADNGTEAIALSESVVVLPAQPGIFSGAILNAQDQVVDSSHPVAAGDVIVIYSTGLGATTPSVPTGQRAPSNPAAIAQIQPTVTIGGVNATVQFAGLTPGFVGLYQVNAVVPVGVASGAAVPVILRQNGLSSNAANIVVR